MKKIILKTVEFLTGAKVHADQSAIKGRKSSGVRDQIGDGGSDWKQQNSNGASKF